MADLERQRAHQAAYRAANREKERARNTAYRAANREKVLARKAAWAAANREKVRACNAAYRAANREKLRARNTAWAAANREKVRARKTARRKKLAPEAVAEAYLRQRVEERGGMCPKFIDPARRGAPDRMVLLPNRPVYFVEMKRYKMGRVASWQERYHEDLRRLGHKVSVLWSKEDVDAFFLEVDLTC
jgi:chromatin segregation and condensation protein Rec8/ScpA/Scc1 (kleisin family)